MLPSIKPLAMMLVSIMFIIACSVQKTDQKVSVPMENTNNKEMTITGKVKSIEFGKDGYTAQIQTDKGLNFAALVSIPNLGGPENYTQLKAGDETSLKGEYHRINGDNNLKVTDIIGVQTIVAGIVKMIKDGKDGYTAQVKSHEGPMYAAVVSISNMGGPDNYTRFKIGENVVLKGKQLVKSGEKRLIVEEILKVGNNHTQMGDTPIQGGSKHTQLFIAETSFRGIMPGSKIVAHGGYIEKEALRTGEGTFEIYRIKDFNNNPCGYFLPDPNNESMVGNITVEAKTAETINGIHIGMTYGELRKILPTLEVHGSEIEGRTYANYNNLSYRLDIPNFTYEVNKEKIPASTKITEIIVNRGVKTEMALNYRYSEISPDEFCWLVNDAAELYGKPSRESRKLGVHYKGEALKVLDSRMIEVDGKKKLWVNVQFTNSIKAGYEDRFADGQVTSTTGITLGWIDGDGNPLINCK